MKFVVGFSCLVALAVTAGITGLPEQQLEQEDQIAVFKERQIFNRQLGCNYYGPWYPDGSVISDSISTGCIRLTCNKGNLVADRSRCRADCRSDDTHQSCPSCRCTFYPGIGCLLMFPNLPGNACRCELTGSREDPKTKCVGTVVACRDPKSPFCLQPGWGWKYCRQGVTLDNKEGDCNGYKGQ